MSITTNPDYVEAIWYVAKPPHLSFDYSRNEFKQIYIPSMKLAINDDGSLSNTRVGSKLAHDAMKEYNDDMKKKNIATSPKDVFLVFLDIMEKKDKEAEKQVLVLKDPAEKIKALSHEYLFNASIDIREEAKAKLAPLIQKLFENIKPLI